MKNMKIILIIKLGVINFNIYSSFKGMFIFNILTKIKI